MTALTIADELDAFGCVSEIRGREGIVAVDMMCMDVFNEDIQRCL